MSPVDLTKRAVLVTGGARRIGRAVCEELAAQGYLVLVHSRIKGDGEAKSLAERLGGLHFSADFRESDAPVKLMDEILSVPGMKLYGLVNNASVFSLEKQMPDSGLFHELFFVNVHAPEMLSKLFFEHLKKNGKTGSVVNIGDSRVIRKNFIPQTPYEETKYKFIAGLESSARAYAPFMRVNVVAPGPVLMPVSPKNSEKGGDILLAARPSPKDVASCVAFLTGNESLTGQLIAVDSGQSLI